MMYNTEIKERFISEFSTSESRREAAKGTFEALEPNEIEWGADVCTRSKDELQPIVEELIGVRSSSKKLRLSILREYAKWCMANNIDGACDEILKINDLGVEKMKRQMVASPQHLQKFMDSIFDKESEETVDNVNRCFYWLAYAGIKEWETTEVQGSDVNFEDMVVQFKGNEYPLYKEGIESLRNCVKLKQFRVIHPNYPLGVYKDRIDGGELLRGLKSLSLEYIRVAVSKKNKMQRYRDLFESDDHSVDLQLSFYKVWLSGLFYRAYELERVGIPPNFMDAAAQHMEGVTYHLENSRNLIGAKQRQLARDYLEDYTRWKAAFSL